MGPAVDELVRRMFDAYNSRDVEALLAVLHPSVRIHSLITEGQPADYHGHQGAREWFTAVSDVFDDWSSVIDEIRPVADQGAAVAFTVTVTGSASGARIDQSYWQGIRSRDGLVDYVGFFRSEEDALSALGPEERK